MAFTFGDVRRNLRKKGFVEDTNKDHVYLRLEYEGKKTHIYTKCSHGADRDDVRHTVASAMRRQLSLNSRAELEDLVRCPMSAERYLELLREYGALPSGSK